MLDLIRATCAALGLRLGARCAVSRKGGRRESGRHAVTHQSLRPRHAGLQSAHPSAPACPCCKTEGRRGKGAEGGVRATGKRGRRRRRETHAPLRVSVARCYSRFVAKDAQLAGVQVLIDAVCHDWRCVSLRVVVSYGRKRGPSRRQASSPRRMRPRRRLLPSRRWHLCRLCA